MPIKFKSIEKAQPGITGGGERKFYATKVSSGDIQLRELAKDISTISTVSTADVMAVLEALLETMPKYLADGKTIRLGDFGSFNIGISSRGESDAKSVTAHSITKNKMRFTPGKELRNTLSTVSYEKISSS